MGIVSDKIKKRETGRYNQEKLQIIRYNFIDIYNRLQTKECPKKLLIQHTKFVNSLQLNLGKKHTSIIALQHFCNTKDKSHAMTNLTQYLNNRNMFKN